MAGEPMPEPLTPPDCDLRDFQRMMIDISRLRQSEFDATPDDGAWRAGLNLWFSAWHSVPAGSLAADDASLAKAAGLGRDLRTWKKVKEAALKGFVACSDGRLYHATVSELALEAWLEKLVQRLSSGAGNAKRWGATFDPTEIEAAIDHSVALLSALAPASKSILKAKRRHSRPDDAGNPTGTKKPSHRDAETVPSGSQEKGTGTGTDSSEEGKPSSASPVSDPNKLAWQYAVEVLREGGMTEPRAKALFGKLLKDHGLEPRELLPALAQAQANATRDPQSYLAAAAQRLAGKRGTPQQPKLVGFV